MPPFIATHPRNIPAAFYKPIGQIVTRWGFTELYMQSIVWHVWGLKDPKAARALTWNINAVQKVKLFKFLAERWIPDSADQKELIEIHTEVENLRAKRNQLAHAVWGRNPAKPTELLMFYLPDIEKHILPKAQRPTLAQVKGWAADLDKLNARLERFHKKIGAPKP
jgi:hypothetical protein